MEQRQRDWKPDPFFFQDQETFQGRPTGKKKHKYEHITTGMVQKLRAVTRARRRIWDKEARRWDMRFPIKDATLEETEIFGAKRRIQDIQSELQQPQEEYQDYQDYQHYDEDEATTTAITTTLSPPPIPDPQEALLLPIPTINPVDMPYQILNACVLIQKHLRRYQTYTAVRKSLTYKQLLRWSRLHRLTVHRTEMDQKHLLDLKLHNSFSKLQATYRGWRGRGKARFVKHRVWSAAAIKLQLLFFKPALVKYHARQLRATGKWQYMSSKMRIVQTVQRWYRGCFKIMKARAVLANLKYQKHRANVIQRMSETYAYHITTTGIWNALKKYKELAEEEQWATKYATMVQAVIRAWGAKKAVHILRNARARREARRQRSSIKIQCLFRGYLKRTEVIKRAYFVVQEAARKRWVVRSSDNVHRNEILMIEKEHRDKKLFEENGRKLRRNVLSYTISETKSDSKKREKERKKIVPESIQGWYDGPHFTKEELFGENVDDDGAEEEEENSSESESDLDSPRYW